MTTSPQHIGLLARSFLVDGEMLEGGAERHLYQLAVAFSQVAEVTLYDARLEKGTRSYKELRVVGLGKRRLGGMRAATKLAVQDGCTHLHFQNLGSIPLQRIGRSVSASFHGVWWDIPYVKRYKKWYPLGAATRWVLPWWRLFRKARCIADLWRCSWVLSVDSSLLRVIQSDLPSLRERLEVVPNFYDIDPEAPPQDDRGRKIVERMLALKAQGAAIVLVPRNVSLGRGALWLIDIVTEVLSTCQQPVSFVFTGLSVTARGSKYERLLASDMAKAEPDIRAAIHFLGGVPHSAMAAVLQVADIVLIPTFAFEGTSLAAIEAMACGRAVVATNIGGLNDVILHDRTGILCQPTPLGIAAATSSLIADPEFRGRLADQAKHHAQANFPLGFWQARIGEISRRRTTEPTTPVTRSGHVARIFRQTAAALTLAITAYYVIALGATRWLTSEALSDHSHVAVAVFTLIWIALAIATVAGIIENNAGGDSQ